MSAFLRRGMGVRAALLAFVGAGLVLGHADTGLAARPNFVVLQTDDQNAATVRARMRGQVGGFRRVMPHTLRQIVRKGTEFRNYYASSPVCSPSRASLLSGQYPWNNGIESNRGGDGGWTGWQNHGIYHQNLPVALQAGGYRTIHVGKFSNGYYDRARGRPESAVPPGWSDWFTTSYVRGTRNYGYNVNVNGRVVGPVGDPLYGQAGPGIDPAACSPARLDEIWPSGGCKFSSDVFAAAAIRTIERTDGPFYLHVDFQAPHGDKRGPRGPQPATRWLGAASETPLPRPPSFNEPNFTDKPDLVRSLAPRRMGSNQKRRLKHSYRRYLESLRSVDDGIGAILRSLRRSGKLRNTYVFVLSDHGLFLGEHRYDWGKFMPYEASSSPFMAVRGPRVPRGEVSRAVVGNVDVPVTIMRLARVRPGYEVDGRPLGRYWRHPDRRTYRPMPIVIGPGRGRAASVSAHAPALRYRGFRLGPYKYVAYARGGEELYDLSIDPEELRNRIDAPAYEGIARFMRSHLKEVTSCSGSACARTLAPPEPSLG